jgi:hypothetical protein
MTDGVDRTVLPIRRPAFSGVAGKTLGDSRPDWGLIGHVKPPAGAPNVQMAFVADEAKPATPGQVTLYVNGKPAGSGRMDHTVPFGFSGYSGLDVGRNNGLVVDRSYAGKAPFAFTGTVKKVVFDVAPHPDGQDEDALHAHAHQAHAARGINA